MHLELIEVSTNCWVLFAHEQSALSTKNWTILAEHSRRRLRIEPFWRDGWWKLSVVYGGMVWWLIRMAGSESQYAVSLNGTPRDCTVISGPMNFVPELCHVAFFTIARLDSAERTTHGLHDRLRITGFRQRGNHGNLASERSAASCNESSACRL